MPGAKTCDRGFKRFAWAAAVTDPQGTVVVETSYANYLKNAPDVLLHVHRNFRSTQGRNKLVWDAMERLLTDVRMRRSWGELAKKMTTDDDWLKLWSAIKSALYALWRKEKLMQQPSKAKRYRAIGKALRSVASEIDGGVLDPRAYRLFPVDVMAINCGPNWSGLNDEQRQEAANSLLREWPSTSELLLEFAAYAEHQANQAMNSVIKRETRDIRPRAFALILAGHFKKLFGTPMYGVIAKIVGVALQVDVTKDFVAQTITRNGSS